MTNRVSTKRALVLSLLSMLLCVSMLIGSTYAWFTDTATTAVNKIQAGTLDVALEMSTDNGATWTKAEGKTLNFMTADNHEEILWEPGCTYALPLLRVVNKGNLSLKYEIVITGIDGDAELNKAIEWTIPAEKTGNLAAGATSDAIAISGHMKADAGNEYQGKSIDGIAITVYATQYSYEKDSNNEKYDTEASFLYEDEDGNVLIGTADELVYFAKTLNVDGVNYAGKTVKLTADIDLGGKKWNALVVKNVSYGFTFDGNDKTVSNFVVAGERNVGFFGTSTGCTIKNLTVKGATVTGINHVAAIAGDALCATIEGCKVYDSTITTLVKSNDDGDKAGAIAGYLSAESTASVTNCVVENCTVRGYRDIGGLIGYANAAAVVTGNTVTKVTLINDRTNNYKNYTTDAKYDANEIVGEYNNNTLDASNTHSEVTISKVVPAASQTELNDAITSGEVKEVKLESGETFTLDNGLANEGTKSRNITFVGDGTATVDVITNAINAEGGELNYQRGSTFTFENLTIQGGEGNFDGIVCDELVYKNCTIKGKLTLYGKATFINCVFENDMANQYSIWTWGGTDVTFEGCTFNTNGKAILLYGQATEAKPTNLVVKNCTFNDRKNGAAGKAAIEIGNDYNATYTLTVENATVNGFADGKNTGSKLWANKNSMDAAHLTVTIDGTRVQ